MGLPKSAVSLLLREARRRPFSGAIATLGRQHVYATAADVARMAARHGVPLASCDAKLHREPSLRERGYLSDDSLYEMLGFSSSFRIDCSDYEAPDELLDLNDPVTPSHLCQRFEVVLDSGTLEHVFDVPAVLRHCCRIVRPGGRIVHLTPTSNSVDHGFYSISPTLLADFYEANGFALNQVLLCRLPRRFETEPWQVYDYLGAARRWMPLGRLDGWIWFTFAVATAPNQWQPRVPQQSAYDETWAQHADHAARCEGAERESAFRSDATTDVTDWTTREPADSLAGRLLRATRHTLLFPMAKGLIVFRRKWVNWWRERRRGRIPFPYIGQF